MNEFELTIDEHYLALLDTILEYGKEKQDRTGVGTLSIFGYTIRHDMTQGFPLLTTKKMAYKSMITELKWFLKGSTNIRYLIDNNCNIWNGDAYKKYLRVGDGNEILSKLDFIDKIKIDDEFAAEWGDLGPIYGKQWRRWSPNAYALKGCNSVNSYDQIQNLINELKANPDSRRLMVNAWNVSELGAMTLPPCHYGFQIYTTELTEMGRIQEYCIKLNKDYSLPSSRDVESAELDKANIPKRKISLMWNQRSVDVLLGLPFNIASYALLLKLIAKEVNMIPDQLIGNLGDTHLYLNHIEQAKDQLNRDPMMLSELSVSNVDILNGEFDYDLSDYSSHPAMKAPLNN